MTIPQESLNKWKDLHSPKDYSTVADRIGKPYELVRRAVKNGKGPDDIVTALIQFYKEKEASIKQ